MFEREETRATYKIICFGNNNNNILTEKRTNNHLTNKIVKV